MLALGLLPASPASAARPTTDACPSTIAEDGFTDTGTDGTVLEEAVDCLVAYGITAGQGRNTYGTGNLVQRDQLATFVLNILDQVDGFARPAASPDAFDDDDASVHEDNINDAVELGIVSGFNDGTFRPTAPVSRAQMATFIVGTLKEAGATLPTNSPDAFADDNQSVHEDNIDILADASIDIVDGEVGGGYNPGRSVARGTMAFFLTRTLEVLVDEGLVTALGAPGPETVTDAPELLRAAIVGTTVNNNETVGDGAVGGGAAGVTSDDFDQSTVRFTFDEAIISAVTGELFHLVTFDGRRFEGVAAERDPQNGTAVLVTFGTNDEPTAGNEGGEVSETELDDVSLATVDADAVSDIDGDTNPVGDAALGTGRTFSAGQTAAPDLMSIGPFRTLTGDNAGDVEADFIFDEEAFVVTANAAAAAERFQLVFEDGGEVVCLPQLDTTTTADTGDFDGDGTTTITVLCDDADFQGRTIASIARGVVLAGAVSDQDESATADGGDVAFVGNTNPLQVVKTPVNNGATVLPDLVSVSFDVDDDTATFVFDDTVVANGAGDGLDGVGSLPDDATGFQVYDVRGTELEGGDFASDTDPDDSRVVVTFDPGALDDAVGASVDEGAVTRTGSTTALNQEDEVGVGSRVFAAGETTGPDLESVSRATETITTTNPITGPSSEDVIVFTFAFDEDLADLSTAGDFTIVDETGERTGLTDCALVEASGSEDEVECTVAADAGTDEPNTAAGDAAGFAAAEAAVLGTVDDGAVGDANDDAPTGPGATVGGNVNPEGAEIITGEAATTA